MLTVEELAPYSISEILILGANPVGVEDPEFMLVSEEQKRTWENALRDYGKSVEEQEDTSEKGTSKDQLPAELAEMREKIRRDSQAPLEFRLTELEVEIYNSFIREKLANTIGQRIAVFNIIDEKAFGNTRPSPTANFGNEKELLDYVAENLWSELYREVRGMEGRLLKPKGKSLDDSVMLNRLTRYKTPNQLAGMKKHVGKMLVNVSMFEYRDSEGEFTKRTLPLIRQLAQKTALSIGKKLGEEVSDAIYEGTPVEDVHISDFVKGLICTTYAHKFSGAFSHPNPTPSTPDLQQKILNTLIHDNRIEITDEPDDFYTDLERESSLRFWRGHIRLSKKGVEHAGEKIIRYPDSFSGKEEISMIVVDARNYFDYYFGPESHMRYKTGREESDKLAATYGKRITDIFQAATSMSS